MEKNCHWLSFIVITCSTQQVMTMNDVKRMTINDFNALRMIF